MANELWQERVARAQQMAAERLGIDASEMLPPRNPAPEGAAAAGPEASASESVEQVPEPAAVEAEPSTAVAEKTPQLASEAVSVGTEEGAAEVPSPAAQRIAEAKARAAASAGKPASANGEAPAVPAKPARPVVRTPSAPPAALEEQGAEGINRREFLTYAWGAALGLISLQGGLATYQFMYPRFRAGEFGGAFPLGPISDMPTTEAPPDGITTGKFWLVNTDAGPKALYMVCTHLGCLYKWAPENNRFECPCHGSKFSREGHYIEGPAPRSLDHFVVEIVEGGRVVSSTEKVDTDIVPPAPPSPDAQVVVQTGRRIVGPSKDVSPALGETG